MGTKLLDNFIGSYPREPKVIILDCDDTNTNIHGQQELSLFKQKQEDENLLTKQVFFEKKWLIMSKNSTIQYHILCNVQNPE